MPSDPTAGSARIEWRDAGASPIWREVREQAFSYAVLGKPLAAGRWPDEYLLAAHAATVESLGITGSESSFEAWLRGVVGDRADGALDWTLQFCPDKRRADGGTRPICAQAFLPLKGGPTLSLIVRLHVGDALDTEAWRVAVPSFREAFVSSGDDSLDIARLADIPAALAVRPADWPVADLEVSASDIQWTLPDPLSADPVRVQTRVRNVGLRDAIQARIQLSVVSAQAPGAGAAQDEIGWVGQVIRDIPANGAVTVDWQVPYSGGAPGIVLQVTDQPRMDGWVSSRFEERRDNNFAWVNLSDQARKAVIGR